MLGKSNISNIEFIPTIAALNYLFNTSEFSLVTEEDTILPEDVISNVFYASKDIELKTSSDENSEVIKVIPKGTPVKLEVIGDKFASIKFEDKTGVVETNSLSVDKIEPEEVEQVKPSVKETTVVEQVKETGSTVETPKHETVTLYTTDVLNVRSSASKSSSRLGTLNRGDKVTGNDLGDWIEFDFNGKTAYVMKAYLSSEKPIIEAPKPEEPQETVETPKVEVPTSSDSSAVETVVNSALAQVGKPYVWAASNPNVGFDCSGLMFYSFKQVGINLNRVAADQYSNGTPVSRDNLQRGDLVFFSYGGYIGHVGLYIGNGQFVHASNYSTGVIISNLSGYYLNTYAGAVRVIK